MFTRIQTSLFRCLKSVDQTLGPFRALGTFLIEEPENGIHPRAIKTVLQSLSSIYRGQVLLATHSPVALNMDQPATLRRSRVCPFAQSTD